MASSKTNPSFIKKIFFFCISILLGAALILLLLKREIHHDGYAPLFVLAFSLLYGRTLFSALKRATKLRFFAVCIKQILCLMTCSTIAISVLIVASLSGGTLHFFQKVSVHEFFTSMTWEPFHAYSPQFGFLPLLLGTLLVTSIAIVTATPIAVLSAITVTQLTPKPLSYILKPIFEIPASVPSIVYGYFGLFYIAPFVFQYTETLHISESLEPLMSAGISVAIMIIPIIFTVSAELIDATPNSWQYGALALGSTRTEVATKIILPYILPGIVSAIFLAITRVIGETMIVVLIIGIKTSSSLYPIHNITTITAQIVNLLNSDISADSPQVLAAYALGLSLFLITFIFSALALYLDQRISRKYKLSH